MLQHGQLLAQGTYVRNVGRSNQQLRLAGPTTAGGNRWAAPHITSPKENSRSGCSLKGGLTTSALPNSRAPGQGRIDVVGLGNLCVDAVLPLEALPPPDVALRRSLLDQLTAAPPDRSSWEVGGNCNFMVAAARLGLRVASVGHIGEDIYGSFMDEVLQQEGVQATTRIAGGQPGQVSPGSLASAPAVGGGLNSTLICFVLVDPASRHAFCSRYDFGPWPLLEGIGSLPDSATAVLRSSRAIFTNGFIFDEMPLQVVQAACSDAIDHGAAIFFDPGPRCQTMMEGPRRAALDLLLDLSCVVLMTEEEARTVTGLEDPEAAAKWVLARPSARAQWVVVKMGGQGALLCSRRGASANGHSPNGRMNGNGNGNGSNGHNQTAAGITTTRLGAVKVKVVDTVGCGDSFASAIVLGYINGWPEDVTLALANAVGGATAMGRGAGRNVARLETVLALLGQGAEGAAGEAGRSAFVRAREMLLAMLEGGQGGRAAGQQLSAAA